MRGEGANKMNNSGYFQSFVSSGPLPPGGKMRLRNKIVWLLNFAGLGLKSAIQHLAGRTIRTATDTGKRLPDAMKRREDSLYGIIVRMESGHNNGQRFTVLLETLLV